MNNENLYKIRVHHLLCMQGFQGYGYNDEFVKNMSKIVDFVKKNLEKSVKIVAECDSICSACPYQKESQSSGNLCIKRNLEECRKQILREKKLAKFLNLDINKSYQIEGLFDKVNTKIHSKKIADKYYCDNCQWHDVCLWYQSKIDV